MDVTLPLVLLVFDSRLGCHTLGTPHRAWSALNRQPTEVCVLVQDFLVDKSTTPLLCLKQHTSRAEQQNES